MYTRSKAAPMDWQRETDFVAAPIWNARPLPPPPTATNVADESVLDVDMADQSALPPDPPSAPAPEPASAPPLPPPPPTVEDEERRPRVFEKNHLFHATRARGAVERARGLRHRRSHRALVPSTGQHAGRGEHGEDEDEDEDDDDDRGDVSLSRAAGTAINYFFSPPVPPPVPAAAAMSHLDWPEVLLGYAQFVFNALILAGILWVAYIILSTITTDVRERVEETTLDATNEVRECSKLWQLYKCGGPEELAPSYSQCREWERCMSRNPSVVGRTTVAASLLADTLNQFVDRLSWKTTLFLLVLVALFVRAANSFFAYFRVQSAQRRSQRSKHTAHDDYYPIPGPRRTIRSRTRTAPPAVPWHPDNSPDASADVTSS